MKASLYLIISACMWGLNFHLLKIMLTGVHFIEAGFWRYLFGVGTLALFMRRSGLNREFFKQNLQGFLIVGVLGLFCFNVLLFWGMKYTSPVSASLIMSLNPLATLVLSCFLLGTGISYRQLAGALLGISGVIYLFCRGNLANLGLAFSLGDLLVFLAMILSAFYHIWVKKYASKLSNSHFTFFTNLVCLVSFSVVLPFFVEPHSINYSFNFWTAAITFGALGTALTYALWNKGVGIIGAGKAGIYMNIVPLSTAVIAVFTGTELTGFHIISGVLILSGLLISQLKVKK